MKLHNHPISGWLCAINDGLSVTYVIPQPLIIIIFNRPDNIFRNFFTIAKVAPAEACRQKHCLNALL
ncbi:hypothetical protein AUC60_09655 [Pseudomonas caspiana]|uniref:Uncharacterized protein n=1 Tax=Pseudomonas caspiana TaxID=1451454 RepID=A0A1Y3P2P5_9PSED|nr:hypothetical protein AUC60_09655 [Pseudomonas caspiana]